MMITWGTQRTVVPRGTIVEVCTQCRATTSHNVLDEFLQPHVYGMVVGQDDYLGLKCICRTCHLPSTLLQRFTKVLSYGLAAELDLDAQIARTNPTLWRHLEVTRRLGAFLNEGGPYRGQHDAGILKEPLEMLEAMLLDGRSTAKLISRLDAWESLDTPARIELVAKIRETAVSSTR